MTLPVRVAGSSGEALALDGEILVCVIERAFAPGSPVACTVALDGGWIPFQGKSRGSRRLEDGRFTVRLRVLSLPQAHRDALESALRD